MPHNLRPVASNPSLGNAVTRPHRPAPAAKPTYDVTTGHRRTPSSSSQASYQSAPGPTIEQLMTSISQAPKGSKMAEDAKKAMRLAERAHIESPRPTRPLNVPARHSSSRASAERSVPTSPTPSEMPLVDQFSLDAIGLALMSPASEDNDPFEFDTGLYATMTPQGSEGTGSIYDGSPPSRPSGVRQGSEDVMLDGSVAGNVSSTLLRNRSQMVRPKASTFSHVHPAQNALAIFWRGMEPQRFALITVGTGVHGADDAFPIEVAAKHTQVVEMPNEWSGRVQRVTGAESDPATRCDIQFGGYKGMTFFGVSYAYGNNGPVVMRSSPSNEEVGSPFRAADVAPNTICVQDASSRRVVVGTQNVTNQRRLLVHKFYREFFEYAEQGAILAEDETGMVATRDRHVLIDFYP